jgi:hypothetical protein
VGWHIFLFIHTFYCLICLTDLNKNVYFALQNICYAKPNFNVFFLNILVGEGAIFLQLIIEGSPHLS